MRLFRRGAGTPPTMTLEGVLGPNTHLDEAEGRAAPGARAIAVAADGALLLTSGADLLRLADWSAEAEVIHRAPADILALAVAPGGTVSMVCAGGALVVLSPEGAVQDWPGTCGVMAATDAAFASEDELLVLDAGLDPGEDMLARAAWDDTARGSVVALTRAGGRRVAAQGLHAPGGLCLDPSGRALVTEIERATIREVSGGVLRAGLPGYLGRLRPMPGGYLLSCLARRDPLIEFLKTERAFVDEMKATVAPAHWIAPRLDPQFSHDLPIEMGATRLFGEVKAWAPSFSYGLLIALDDQLRPAASAHSRANGSRHAIGDALIWQGAVIALCLGTGELLRLEGL